MRSKKCLKQHLLSLKQIRKNKEEAKKNKCQSNERPADFDSIQYPVSESPLEKLPKELINALIELAPEAVSGLRLASRVLHSRVCEHARTASNMKLVDKVHFRRNSAEFHSFTVPARKRDLFEMRLRLQLPKQFIIIRERPSHDNTTYSVPMSQFAANDVLKALGSVIGRNIGELIVAGMPESTTLKRMLLKFLDGVKFTRLHSSLQTIYKREREFLLEIMQLYNIESISFEVTELDAGYPGDVHVTLFEFSTVAKSMKIHQLAVTSNSPLFLFQNYLFGLLNENWPWIISEMFSRKLEKLEIVNDHGNYLSSDDAYLLRNKLRFIEKKLWFTTTFYNLPHSWNEYYHDGHHYHQLKLHNYIVRVDKINGQRILAIQHVSRVNEPFD